MKLNNNKNIIVDSDITMTGAHTIGKELSTVVDGMIDDIAKLKGNIAWAYRFGGLGGGSGSGGSSASSNNFGIIVTANGQNVSSSGATITFESPGTYTFSVRITKGGSDAFKVVYNVNGKTYNDNNITSQNDFTSTKSFQLAKNGTLTISVMNNSTMEYYTLNNGDQFISYKYIVTPYTFGIDYYAGHDTQYADEYDVVTSTNGSVFMSNYTSSGILLGMKYALAVPVNTAESNVEYVDWDGNSHKSTFDELNIANDSSGIKYMALSNDILEYLSNKSNAGYKSMSVRINIKLNESTTFESPIVHTLNVNLIPTGLYLKVASSTGTLYDTYDASQSATSENQFNSTGFSLTITPYYGGRDTTRTYTYNFYVYNADNLNDAVYSGTGTANDQTNTILNIKTSGEGYKAIYFTLTCNQEAHVAAYTKWYYISVKAVSSSFNWYHTITEGDTTRVNTPFRSSYYRKGLSASNIVVDPTVIINQENTDIRMTANSNIRTVSFTSTIDENKLPELDAFLALGIQYSKINDYDMPICSFNAAGSTAISIAAGSIFIYQNKVIVTSNESKIAGNTVSVATKTDAAGESTLFIPLCEKIDTSDSGLSNYHLVNIYKNLESRTDNNYNRSMKCFIDGTLDGVAQTFTASHKNYESITFYPANYDVNLIERSYFEHTLTNNEVVATADDENYNERKYVTENDIAGFWYSYKQQLLNSDASNDREMQIYNIFDQFRYTKDNHVIVEPGVAADLARLVDCPVIELVWQDNGNGAGGYSGNGQNNCMLWLDKSYGENDREYQVDVILKYAQEGIGSELRTITLPGSSTPATFRIEIQGSSTKSYLAKNLELYAPSSTATTTFVYTPNWDIESSKSFLPENSFTLKKDVVDSSHTNNNAIADFVDVVTTKYEDAAKAQDISPDGISSLSGMSNAAATDIINKYKRKIKNCLSGFPVLVFLNTTYYDTDGVNTKNENYFLGIYNFNLGRKSYNNLGYNSLQPIINALSAQGVENGFNLFEINNDEIKMIPSVEVAEIQGNSSFYDFSQYDDTILNEMWGDYISGSESSSSQMTHLKAHIKSLVQNISKSGGYVFTSIGKAMSENPDDNFGYDYGYGKLPTENADGTTTMYVPNYMQQVHKSQSSSTGYNYVWTPTNAGTESNYIDTILRYTNTDTQEIHTPVVDFASLSEYYTICMAFGMVDSVQKNLNMKSWTANIENDQTMGQRWYPAFYDMDTGLGINNAGNRINYFAFSDYWKSSITKDSKGNNVLSQATIWRDYAPHDDANTSAFFDVPSSYLFAMCKYASVLLKSNEYYNEGAYIYNDPVNIWATLRDGVQSTTNKMQGQLSSAKYFIDNYFKHHLDTIPDEAFNLDYVYNYLYKKQGVKSTVFDEQNVGKFWGRKIAYVEYWLDGRLHILDAYFNINQITNDLIYTNPLTHTQYFATSPEQVPVNNDDIYLLREIFSNTVNGSTTGQQYQKGTIVVNVTANPYSPLVVQKAGKEKMRYLFPAESIPVQMTFEVSGTEYWVFFGSQQWTSLSSINGFINQSGAFIVNSDYFASLVGNAGTCGTWAINTPALKTLSLTSENYSGTLDFNGNVETSERTQYENLDSIDISNTAINLNVNKMNVTSITALNMKGTNLICTDLPNISSMQVSGTFISLTLCSWQHNIRLPYSGTLNVDTITISNDTQRFPDNILNIYGSNVKTINASGFAYINIENCPNLTNVNITDEDAAILKGISVVMPNETAAQPVSHSISINGNDANIFDLSKYVNLESICFNNCTYLSDVILPEKDMISMKPMCFANCSTLAHITNADGESLNTALYITGQRTFYNCPSMNFIDSAGQPTIQIYVASDTTTLRDTFWCESAQERINLSFAVSVLERCTSQYVGNVTDITNMFRNTPIRYTVIDGDGMSEYNSKYSSLSLAGFESCANWTDVFRNTEITFMNRYIFGPSSRGRGIAYNMTSIDFRPLGADTRFSVTTDSMYEIIDKVARYYGSTRPVQFVDSHANEMTAVKLNDFFCPLDKRPEKLFYIDRFKCESMISSTRIDYDFDGMFDCCVDDESQYKWLALHGAGARALYLNNMIDNTIYTSNVASLEYLLHNVKLQYVVNSLNVGIIPNETKNAIDLANFIDWENGLGECTNLFLANMGIIEGISMAAGFQIDKYVSYDNMHHIIESLLKCKNLECVSAIFKNAVVVMNEEQASDWFSFCDNENLSDNGYDANTSIKYMNDMFNGMSLRPAYNSPTQYPIKINHDFMRFFPNVIGFAYTFANLYVANTLPFDFFRKRYETTSKVIVDASGNTGTLHTFAYRREIMDAQYCFENISMPAIAYTGGSIDDYNWDGQYAFHSYGPYNEDSFKRDYVERDDNGAVQYEYYVNNTLKTLKVNDEIQDALNAEQAGYSTYKYHINDEYNTNKVLFNISYVDPTGLFVAPDIFYGFAQSGIIENFFAVTHDRIGTALTGTIPQHMLKDQNINKSFIGILNNMNITPIYLGQRYDTASDDGHIYKYYVYVPEGFTTKQQLSDCFKFNIILPYSTIEYREYFICMLTSSVSIYTGSLVNAFPDSSTYLRNDIMTGTLFPSDADSVRKFSYGDTGIRYALCGEISATQSTQYSNEQAERTLSTISVSSLTNKVVTISTTDARTYHYKINDGPTYTSNVRTMITVDDNCTLTIWIDGDDADSMTISYTFNVTIGFNSNTLTYLLYDNLVMQRDILCILSGYMFSNMMQWTGAKVNVNASTYVLYTSGMQTIPMEMSYNLLLNATSSNDRLLLCSLQGNKKYVVSKNTLFNYSDSQSEQWVGTEGNYNSAIEIV